MLCSCRLPNSSGNPDQGGCLLTSTKLKTISMSIHWSCMHPIENVALIADIPNFFSKNRKILPMYRWFVYSMFLNSDEHAASFLVPGGFSSLFIFGFDPFAPVSWRLEGSSLVDSLDNIRPPISNYRAPSFLVPGRFFLFHRHSPD